MIFSLLMMCFPINNLAFDINFSVFLRLALEQYIQPHYKRNMDSFTWNMGTIEFVIDFLGKFIIIPGIISFGMSVYCCLKFSSQELVESEPRLVCLRFSFSTLFLCIPKHILLFFYEMPPNYNFGLNTIKVKKSSSKCL